MKLGIHMTREERLAAYRRQLRQTPTAGLEVLEAEGGEGLFWDAVRAELAERRRGYSRAELEAELAAARGDLKWLRERLAEIGEEEERG